MAARRASAVLVGCGAPLRSMGWYHAEQLLANRCPSAQLTAVVEPFYMKADNQQTPGYTDFQKWRQTQEAAGISFYADIQDVPKAADNLRMGIISARTADNPALLDGCVDMGCQTVYLEKPGAPSVAELKAMKTKADQGGTKVYMGFNKNVSAYLERTLAFAKDQTTPVDVTFLHNNAYAKADLPECFERNAEGMLKNMAIHELAMLVTFYGVSVDNIASVEADTEYSSCQTLQGPESGTSFTDFDKLKFKIITKDGKSASVAADRCGGDDSVGIVTSSNDGKELARYVMPDADAVANVSHLEKLHPGAMPYFFAQDPDYCNLKERIAKACVTKTEPQGVATIDTAIATLSLAEYLTPLLLEQLK